MEPPDSTALRDLLVSESDALDILKNKIAESIDEAEWTPLVTELSRIVNNSTRLVQGFSHECATAHAAFVRERDEIRRELQQEHESELTRLKQQLQTAEADLRRMSTRPVTTEGQSGNVATTELRTAQEQPSHVTQGTVGSRDATGADQYVTRGEMDAIVENVVERTVIRMLQHTARSDDDTDDGVAHLTKNMSSAFNFGVRPNTSFASPTSRPHARFGDRGDHGRKPVPVPIHTASRTVQTAVGNPAQRTGPGPTSERYDRVTRRDRPAQLQSSRSVPSLRQAGPPYTSNPSGQATKQTPGYAAYDNANALFAARASKRSELERQARAEYTLVGGEQPAEEARPSLRHMRAFDVGARAESSSTRRPFTYSSDQGSAGFPEHGALAATATGTSTHHPLDPYADHSRPSTSGEASVNKRQTLERVGQDQQEALFAEGAAERASRVPATANEPTPGEGVDADLEGKPLRINISTVARIENSVLNENMKMKLVKDLAENNAGHIVRQARRIKDGKLVCWHVHGISKLPESNYPAWTRADFNNGIACSACLGNPSRQCFKITEDSLGFRGYGRPASGLMDESSGFLLAATAQQHREQYQKDMENDSGELYE